MSYSYSEYWRRSFRGRKPEWKRPSARIYVYYAKDIVKNQLARYTRVLDVGCGVGTYVKKHQNFVGLDINRRRLKQFEVRAVQGDAIMLPFQDKTFEASYTMQTLMHIPENLILRVLSELVRVTRVKLLHIEAYHEKPRRLAFHCFNHDLEQLYEEISPEIRLLSRARVKELRNQVCWIFVLD